MLEFKPAYLFSENVYLLLSNDRNKKKRHLLGKVKKNGVLYFIGDKLEDYGKQKCWGSIGWGTFSILIGWLVDRFSVNQKDKDYSPVFYSAIILTFFNVISVSKMKVRLYIFQSV